MKITIERETLERECDDGDNLLLILGLDPATYRTEGGRLNLPKIRAALAQQAEPDMRHPKIQALIGSRARCQIELGLVEQLLEDPNFEMTAMDMEYWGPTHDKLKERLTAPAAGPPGYVLVPIEPTRAMVEAYLSANSAYWERIDAMPTKIGVWRNGTPKEATEVSYRAMIAAAGDKS